MSANLPVGDQDHRAQSDGYKDERFRIAIVGCGPRGLHCLLELTKRLQQCNVNRPLSVTVFELSEFPGAGNVYHPRQPKFLRMNFAAKHINAWRPTDAATDRQRCLMGWLRSDDRLAVDAEDFVPRAVVGSYLNDCFLQTLAELREFAAVTILREPVTTIECGDPTDRLWRVSTDRQRFVFDEVVLTVGHEGWRQRDSGCALHVPEMLPTFPVDRCLNHKTISPGSTVAVRGFGLTWIDAALALTEGREGVFSNDGHSWSYHRSGREPKRLLPFSRSGRPMLAKPDELLFVQTSELQDVWENGRRAITAVCQPFGKRELVDRVWRAITTAAALAANHFINANTGKPRWSARSVERWFQQWTGNPIMPTACLSMMRHSWRVATGQATPDVTWALAAAWRNLYPALVQSVSYGGLAADAWPEFRKISVEMERIAFGPPAQNVGRILALVDAGVVDLKFLAGKGIAKSHIVASQFALSNGCEVTGIDHVVDAVIPSALQNCPAGPIRSLLNSGVIRRLHGTEGVHVDEAGRPIREDGYPVDGLAILGRATEGCVLGNDSLSRTLHDQPRRWAATAVRQIQCPEASHLEASL